MCIRDRFYYGAGEIPEEMLSQVRAVLGNPPMELLKKLPALELLQLSTAGVGFYTRPGALPEKVVLTNASGAYGAGIAEHMLGMALTPVSYTHLYALTRSCDKFIRRFAEAERLAGEQGLEMKDAGPETLDRLWKEAKKTVHSR